MKNEGTGTSLNSNKTMFRSLVLLSLLYLSISFHISPYFSHHLHPASSSSLFKLSSQNKPKSSPGGRNPKQSKRKTDTRGGKKGNRNAKMVVKKEEKIMKTDVTKENTHQPPWAIGEPAWSEATTTLIFPPEL